MYPEQVNLDKKSAAKLRAIYKKAYKEMVQEIQGASAFGVSHRKALLAQVRVILAEMGADVNKLIKDDISTKYKEGADDAVRQLNNVSAKVGAKVSFNKIHKKAIEALVDDAQTAFLESLQGVNRSATRLINQGVRDQITEELAKSKVKGEVIRAVKNNIVGILQNEGLAALVDKGGKRWELDRYAEMLIRTKAVEARNRGLANRIAENGYDLVQVSAHGTDHTGNRGCARWEGRILSVTGATPGYKTVAQATEAGLFHPNCKHAINVLVPSLAKVTNAYNPNINTLSGNEFVDQVDVDLKGLRDPGKQVVVPKT